MKDTRTYEKHCFDVAHGEGELKVAFSLDPQEHIDDVFLVYFFRGSGLPVFDS